MDYGAPPTNYASFEEHREGAEQLHEKERPNGWMDWRKSEQELEAAYGAVTYVSKMKGEAQKLRLIHDLRCSGVNQRITMRERIVLSRISDVVEDVFWVIDRLRPDEQRECLVLDFETRSSSCPCTRKSANTWEAEHLEKHSAIAL